MILGGAGFTIALPSAHPPGYLSGTMIRRTRGGRSGSASTFMGALLLVTSGCGDGGESRLDSFTMTDLPAPSMFVHLATGRDRPFVLELPPVPGSLRFDLSLTDVTEREILDEIVRRDPSYQHAQPGDALVFWPTGKAEATSAYSKRIARFTKEGGIADVVAAFMDAAGSPAEVHAEKAVGRRPVSLDLEDVMVRDALVELARQAHVGLIVEAGRVSVSRLGAVPSVGALP